MIVCSWASLEDTDKIKEGRARRASQGDELKQTSRDARRSVFKSIHESFTGQSRQQFRVDWRGRGGGGGPSLYNHVRKLSLSILVAANMDSMSFRMSELSASCRLGISSSPSTAILSLSRVPRSTSVPGMASR